METEPPLDPRPDPEPQPTRSVELLASPEFDPALLAAYAEWSWTKDDRA